MSQARQSVYWQPDNSVDGGHLLFDVEVPPVLTYHVDAINTNSPQTIVLSTSTDTMYAVNVYLSSRLDGSGSQTLLPSIFWTDRIGAQSLAGDLGSISGDASSPTTGFTTPIWCKGGTSITVSTAYAGGGTPFYYDLDVRIVTMPA